jgi:1-acyl-sn-glycerol-3-phosphate acyltransferase
MTTPESAPEDATGDQPWSRTRPARAARELVLRGVFGSIIRAYSRVEIAGAGHLAGIAGPVIFVANHRSHVDTPVLLRAMPWRWRRRTAVAAAADYFYAQRALAAAVSLAFGTVPVERHGLALGTDATAHLGHLLDSGWNLIVFAEGTRSRDGRVGPMRSGAAVLAAERRVPIVPVYITGTGEAMPIGRKWMIRPERGGRWSRNAISVTFGAPVEVAPVEDRGAVMARVRGFMGACGAELVPQPKRADRGAPAAPAARPAAGQHV